jgi:glycosyltransferase involved in cell wall biosynthesis
MKCDLLYLVGQLGSGGLERQLYYLLQTVTRKCYQPAVAVWNDCENDVYTPQIRALGVPIHSFPRTFSPPAKLVALRRLVRELHPAVAHSYSFYTNFGVYWATRGTSTVAVGSLRGELDRAKKESGRWLGSLSARWPREQICNNFSALEAARRSRGLFVPQRLSVVRNGLDLDRFHSLPLPVGGRVYIVGVGSLFSVKRWDRLLRAALALKQRGFDFLVRLVGDGPLRDSLRQQTQNLCIADCVEFLGNRDDVPSILAEATFLVHTSDSEGCPNVVMEAMACGRAVVATEVGDIPLLIEDEKTGFVVPRGDETALVTHMATLISNRDLCHRMGNAGRAKAEQEFGLDRLVTETLSVYRDAGWRGFSTDHL